MATWAAFVPNRSSGTVQPLELFPSREVAGRCLRERARTQRGRTWYADSDLKDRNRPTAEWPTADSTALLLVWRRTAADPAPRLTDPPTETWRLSPGFAVIREPWSQT